MKSRLDKGFGVTVDDNSIHRINNSAPIDTVLGVAARSARHVVSFGNNVGAAIGNKERRPAYNGVFGATRASAMEVLSTPLRLVTEKNRIGTAINGVTAAFDVVANATIVDPLTMVAGDHTNTAQRRISTFTQEQKDAAPYN